MDDKAMQKWGVIVGGGAVAAALAAATISGGPKPADPTSRVAAGGPAIERPITTPAAHVAPPAKEDEPVVEPASSITPPPPAAVLQVVTYVVRFRPEHPLGRAQALAAQGDAAAAAQAARASLRTQSALRGMCFDRFTLGGAEVVLRPCNPVPAPQRAAFQQQWNRRFAQMTGVEYAEPNVTLMPEERG